MRIGIDFDNTIICYDTVFTHLAITNGLIPKNFQGTKTQVRDSIRTMPDGDTKWQHLQGKAYGVEISRAVMFDGFKAFVAHCNANNIELYIVSHKTEHGHFDETRTSLREAARSWLRSHGIFDQNRPHILEKNVYFETTREEKIERIKSLNCTHFIDDLIEVLDSPLFPKHIERILFQPKEDEHNDHTIQQTYSDWNEIHHAFFSR